MKKFFLCSILFFLKISPQEDPQSLSKKHFSIQTQINQPLDIQRLNRLPLDLKSLIAPLLFQDSAKINFSINKKSPTYKDQKEYLNNLYDQNIKISFTPKTKLHCIGPNKKGLLVLENFLFVGEKETKKFKKIGKSNPTLFIDPKSNSFVKRFQYKQYTNFWVYTLKNNYPTVLHKMKIRSFFPASRKNTFFIDNTMYYTIRPESYVHALRLNPMVKQKKISIKSFPHIYHRIKKAVEKKYQYSLNNLFPIVELVDVDYQKNLLLYIGDCTGMIKKPINLSYRPLKFELNYGLFLIYNTQRKSMSILCKVKPYINPKLYFKNGIRKQRQTMHSSPKKSCVQEYEVAPSSIYKKIHYFNLLVDALQESATD